MTKSTEIKHKTALVLEGGAMRGMYTAGVLDVFMKKILSLMHLFVCQQAHYLV